MLFKPVFLWTDIFLYFVFIFMIIFIISFRKNILAKEVWGKVSQKPFAMFSFVIVLFFSYIALLDSIHFYPLLSTYHGEEIYSSRMQSVLDILVSPLGQNITTTYSAPFSISIASSAPNISINILFSLIKALFFGALLLLLVSIYLSKKHKTSFLTQISNILTGKSRVAWRSTFSAIFLIFLCTFVLLCLSQYYYIFGTDKIGNDVFYQTIKSIRTGLVIGTLTTLFMLPFAIFFGTIAGYFSGLIDDIVQYTYTLINSIPGVLLIAATILSLQIFIKDHPDLFGSLTERADARLLILCIILGLTVWTELCRLIRAETLKLREMEFVEAAIVMGVSHYRIILKHIIPNLMHIILITVVLNFSMLVLAEAVLSYVGVGVDPTTASWGNMINSARFELAREPIVWWPLTAAFLFMFILVLCANIFSDALRDALDPRTQTS